MKKKLKNLDEQNAQNSLHWSQISEPQLNGIGCPECGEELYDTNPMITLTTFPAKKSVKCSKCDYFGYRIV